MAHIKKEDVVAIWIEDGLFCLDCRDVDVASEFDELMTVDELENQEGEGRLLFCDGCGKKITVFPEK